LVISKVKHPTLQLQCEGEECQHGNGHHICDIPYVPPKMMTRSAVLSVVVLCALNFYTLIILFSASFRHISLLFPNEITTLAENVSSC
jgi:hypothetical protein